MSFQPQEFLPRHAQALAAEDQGHREKAKREIGRRAPGGKVAGWPGPGDRPPYLRSWEFDKIRDSLPFAYAPGVRHWARAEGE